MFIEEETPSESKLMGSSFLMKVRCGSEGEVVFGFLCFCGNCDVRGFGGLGADSATGTFDEEREAGAADVVAGDFYGIVHALPGIVGGSQAVAHELVQSGEVHRMNTRVAETGRGLYLTPDPGEHPGRKPQGEDMSENARGFGSDNHAGVHPQILQAMVRANTGHARSYGEDPYTAAATARFREHFGEEIEVFFVLNGTAANVLSLAGVTRSHHAVICAEESHLNTEECGAPEQFTGLKLLSVPDEEGKIAPAGIAERLRGVGNPHWIQPRVVSITQSTELGTVYSLEEIRAIAEFTHQHDMLLHMDGARLSNAAVNLGVELRETTVAAGVDVLSFGGTKNGLMLGEAVVFFERALAEDFQYVRKQGMQLASKMRFIAVQFEALLANDLWRQNAGHANRMARLLAEELERVPQVRITHPVQANAVFATLPKEYIPALQQEYFFYMWDENKNQVRWMTAFDTTEEDVRGLVACIEKIAK